MGIHAWEELLLVVPRKYEDFTRVAETLTPSVSGEKQTLWLTVSSRPNIHSFRPARLSLFVSDEKTRARITVFGNIFEWKNLKQGQRILVRGVVEFWNSELQVNKAELIERGFAGKVMPRYPSKRGVVSEQSFYEKSRIAIKDKLADTADFLAAHYDCRPNLLLKNAGIDTFSSLTELLKCLHAPVSLEQANAAIAAAKKLAIYRVIEKAIKTAKRDPAPRSVVNIRSEDVRELASCLPWPLSEEQRAAINDIVTDLRKPFAMQRLLSGDVGTGKTVTFLIPLLAARHIGAKVVIMVPNTILVEQITNDITGHFAKSKIPCPVLPITGKSTKALDLSDNPIIVATSAILSRLKKWVPDILVVDEQHKWSRQMREELVEANTNVLEATATCIPRTAALVTHGGMDVSILRKCPVEKRIHSQIVYPTNKRWLLEHVHTIIEAGYQAAFIYPKVEDTDDSKLSVDQAYELWEKRFPGQVAKLHGKMNEWEKKAVIQSMKEGQFKLLISSTVIEVGVTLPDLKTLAVIDATRHGVSALHQLRGRVARHGGTGYFFMYTGEEELQEETLQRLQLLENYSDGFTLAEKDMELRGFGDLSDDSDDQNGVATTMFRGIKLLPKDLAEYQEAQDRVAA